MSPTLSTLPPELLRLVIESTVPHTFHSTTYKQRRNTLRSLSLVSHRFRQIAQPLLFEIVWVGSGRKGPMLDKGRQKMKVLVMEDQVSRVYFGQLEDWRHNLRSLTIRYFDSEPLDLSLLLQCPSTQTQRH
jgi:hypothetical protein